MHVRNEQPSHDPGAIDLQATATTCARYDRLAPLYDRMERGMERRFAPLRRILWQRVKGPRVLEIGVGTGANMPYYSSGVETTAIDLSPRMLAQAHETAQRLGITVMPDHYQGRGVTRVPLAGFVERRQVALLCAPQGRRRPKESTARFMEFASSQAWWNT